MRLKRVVSTLVKLIARVESTVTQTRSIFTSCRPIVACDLVQLALWLCVT